MSAETPIAFTPVERVALERSEFEAIYPPAEKIPTLIVNHFPALGKLAAMRFIEWVQQNPGGAVSLPTGKTPEHFINWVGRLTKNWNGNEIQADLEDNGIDPSRKPDLKSLHFVQIDEFYPINPMQMNSFFHYVNHYYLDGFDLSREKALLIDCREIGLKKGDSLESIWPGKKVDLSLRHRPGATALERRQKDVLHGIDEWCQEYEEKIRDLGGIGFFLGGIGPDGHIGFNVRGSDHHSDTRLAETNYETQAAAASDLGGIEVSRDRLVITIGLETITYNPGCTAIILAAGAAKAAIVEQAVQGKKSVLTPASALRRLPNARFYITRGASHGLAQRQRARLETLETVTDEEGERFLIDLAVSKGKRLLELTEEDIRDDSFAANVVRARGDAPKALAEMAHESLVGKIERGAEALSGTRFLHTEPHHDDLMLGYLPRIVRHVRNATNVHNFATFTSGFTAVTNHFMKEQCVWLGNFIDSPDFFQLNDLNYFAPDNAIGRNRDVWQYLDGVAAGNPDQMREGHARRLLRDLRETYDESSLDKLKERIVEIENYCDTEYPGKKDPEIIQRLKGMRREWEVECLWGYFGWNCSNVKHLRLGFYKGDVFTEEPTAERDIPPILSLLEETAPDVISVALDPEASGPDTHYKALQAVTEAVKTYERQSGRSDMKIWGYRNVWYRFMPSEANIFVPVSLNMFSIMQSAFMNTILSQREASFPSYEHDGPFCDLAQRIQVEQYQKIKTCLGRGWFYEHHSALIRATRGLVFMKEMTLPEFYEHSRDLKKATVNQ